MLPIVETKIDECKDKKKDRRKHRNLFWKEVKLAAVQEQGETKTKYAASFLGPSDIGARLLEIAEQSGYCPECKVHGLGDGAPWITDQMDRQFGAQCTYHVDYYHACEYLHAAAEACPGKKRQVWLKKQKEHLLNSRVDIVIDNLKEFMEQDNEDDQQKATPVKDAYRYFVNRKDQFKYREAKAQDLPIGSGLIESSHRHVLQERLKIAGAWWHIENAQSMADLRVLRANDHWQDFWKIAA